MADAVEEDTQFRLLDELEAFKLSGRDKSGRRILRVVGKFFPGMIIKPEALTRYLEERILPELIGKDKGKGFVIVYFHACVDRSENFPGVSSLRMVYESLSPVVRDNLETVFFVHPGLQSRLFFATFGRFLFSSGLYGKLRYVNRLEFLWDKMRKKEVEVPEFVVDHDEELEYRPLMDYGLESDYQQRRAYDAPAMDSAASMHSLRCIS